MRCVLPVLISIHALLAESDGCRCPPRHWHGGFLSTLSLRRATVYCFSPALAVKISIHALLAESDPVWKCRSAAIAKFLSTLSLRRATRHWTLSNSGQLISIHALLAESDALLIGRFTAVADFYPRSPCGERPYAPPPCGAASVFLSTLSLRRATN